MKIYYQSKVLKIIYSLCLTVLFAFMYYVILLMTAPAIFLLSFIAIWLINIIFTPSIKVSPDGIEYSSYPLRTIKVGWEGFSRIGKNWFSEGLFIRTGYLVTLANSPLKEHKIYGGFLDFAFIHLSSFSENWRESELGRQINQYAPHLFSPVENQETP